MLCAICHTITERQVIHVYYKLTPLLNVDDYSSVFVQYETCLILWIDGNVLLWVFKRRYLLFSVWYCWWPIIFMTMQTKLVMKSVCTTRSCREFVISTCHKCDEVVRSTHTNEHLASKLDSTCDTSSQTVFHEWKDWLINRNCTDWLCIMRITMKKRLNVK